jgi:hypothetical protein
MNLKSPWQLGLGGMTLVSIVLGVTSCSKQTTPLATHQREAIQSRAATVFTNVVLFKPVEGGAESPLAIQLAPLILQEVTQTNAANLGREEFGSPDSPPQVVYEVGSTAVNQRSHQQFSYTWNYPAQGVAGATGQKIQGVRLTLNAAGAPVIWEVRADSSGAGIIYVAQSLELAARAEFGPPLPGRKFSIERDLAKAANIVVANVIEDGPMVMGPIVYLQRENRDVTAVICRCMSAQFHTLVGQAEYELVARQATNGPAPGFSAGSLEARLRLPGVF